MAMGMIMFILTYNATQSVWLAFIVSLVTGLFIGWLNGIIVVKFGIPSLVATIGTQFFWRGAVLVLSQGKSGTLVYTKDTLLYPLLVGKIGGVFPVQMLWLIFIAVGSWVLLNRHQFGAHMYLIGDNPNSAKLMGVNTGRARIKGFMLVGLISAFAGVVASLHVTYFWPSLGEGYLPGRNFSIRWCGHDPGLVYRRLHDRRHRGCHRRHRLDRFPDAVDLWTHHRPLGRHAYLPGETVILARF